MSGFIYPRRSNTAATLTHTKEAIVPLGDSEILALNKASPDNPPAQPKPDLAGRQRPVGRRAVPSYLKEKLSAGRPARRRRQVSALREPLTRRRGGRRRRGSTVLSLLPKKRRRGRGALSFSSPERRTSSIHQVRSLEPCSDPFRRGSLSLKR